MFRFIYEFAFAKKKESFDSKFDPIEKQCLLGKRDMVVDVEQSIPEHVIRNDFWDLLYQDDLFPETNRFSTPTKELARSTVNQELLNKDKRLSCSMICLALVLIILLMIMIFILRTLIRMK